METYQAKCHPLTQSPKPNHDNYTIKPRSTARALGPVELDQNPGLGSLSIPLLPAWVEVAGGTRAVEGTLSQPLHAWLWSILFKVLSCTSTASRGASSPSLLRA